MFSFLFDRCWIRRAKKLEAVLARTLSRSRFQHSVRVAHTARAIARRHCVNPGKAWFAGLVHDLAREWSDDELGRWASKHGAALFHEHRQSPVLAHGHAAAWILATDYGVRSASVLSAIRHHTLGWHGLDRLGLIVFAADYLEPGRKFTTRTFRRWALHLELREMVLACMAHNDARGKASGTVTEEFRLHLSKSAPGAIVLKEHASIKDLKS